MFIDPEHDSAPTLASGGEQKIPFNYQAIYTFNNKETVIHEEMEYVHITHSRKHWKKQIHKQRAKKKAEQKAKEAAGSDEETNAKEKEVDTYKNDVIFDDKQAAEGSGEVLE